MKIRQYPLLFLALLLAASSLAAAEEPPPELYRWTALAADAQLAADATDLPANKGAVFVPALSPAADEPEVLVFGAGDDSVAAGPTGARILLDPGTYTVRIGSGATRQMAEAKVDVEAGQTVTVPVTWGGLRVEVVDTSNIPHRGTYELIKVGDRDVLGIGYGADTLQAETLRTWLLTPGLYRIVRSGETYRARSNFATVDVPAGGLVHFKLVTEPTTGDFRGAGVVDASEFVVAEGGAEQQLWTPRVVLGGAVSLNSTDDVVGQPNQDVFSGTVYFDSYLTYKKGKHFGTGIFEIEEGLVRVSPADGNSLPTQKAQDRLRADAVYTYFVDDRIGPYARAGFITNIFASDVLVTEDTTVAFNNTDGNRSVQFVPSLGEYRTADAFGALRFREGAGLNVRLLRNSRATANFRVGLGLRQNLFNSAFVQLDDPSTPELDLFEIDDFNEEGIETTFTATLRIADNLLYITDLELFGDFGELDDPTIDWRNTLSFRLLRYASLDYTFDALRIPQVLDATQTTQSILLRFSFNVL